MRASQLLGLAIALATSTMANPVPQMDTTQAAGPESPNMELDGLQHVEARDAVVNSAATSSPGCTKLCPLMPAWTWGPTRTIWTTTTTMTRSIDCGLCTAVTEEFLVLGVPPVVIFTTTTTDVKPSTTTVLACAAPTAAPANTVNGGPEHTPAL